MIPTLHPDILRNIIGQVCGEDDGTLTYKREQQCQLARLMTVSKVFHEICTDGIYKDCLVSSLNLFLDGLGDPLLVKQDQLSKMESLRVSHHPHIVNPSYLQLMHNKRPWEISGMQQYPNDHTPDRELEEVFKLRFDAGFGSKAAKRIREAMREGIEVLPKLKRVVMMGEVDTDAAMRHSHREKAICEVLISMPSVEYYCQASGLGPLSRPNVVYQPLYPPRIATFHLSRSTKNYENLEFPPVIVGAINRYVLSGFIRMTTPCPIKPSDITGQFLPALVLATHMLYKRTHVTKQLVPNDSTSYAENGSCTEQVPLESVSLDNTSVEIYNFFINVISPDIMLGAARELKPEHTHPLSLEACQALKELVDSRIGAWRGKVTFRNGSDLPVCPACLKDGPIPANEATHYNDEGYVVAA